ncbi:alpha/beta hydrolase [Parahaliea aestuarii]|uniref:Palmitoyl-protein thioesterase ABHD10, mitochondrial n=1 Tax=Parahaliea aestuarii TaxID=1852021 RepID=A0A5C8ZVU7_9GAMM|nr:alpha/beta hydrolase [Parahaliea aestuarii]TXS91712.1 alpha/beta hydrolase [Parahaliea aestuarii]
MIEETQFDIAGPDGRRLACRHRSGSAPGVLFCPGFHSDMQGCKAEALTQWCDGSGRQFTRFDYSGHGASSGDFADGTIGAWLADALAVLDTVASGPQILVGSSMGGWLSLLMALARPERVCGLMLIAPAPDFTDRLYRDRLTPVQRQQLDDEGLCLLPSEYDEAPWPISRQLIEEARSHFLAGRDIVLEIPVIMLQGQRDDSVPWRQTLELVDRIRGPDVELQLIKSGDHRLSEAADLRRMIAALEGLLLKVLARPARP